MIFSATLDRNNHLLTDTESRYKAAVSEGRLFKYSSTVLRRGGLALGSRVLFARLPSPEKCVALEECLI